ncbi:MAG: cytochrome d ubiquinol oxidase subunit II [Planctomycetia bacterium]|nr:cytochrome d ubiquinol oxidase subunit II [Planctomycetia bacterium]
MQPEMILLVVVFGALTLYSLLGGADFGAGVWEVNAAVRSSDRERAMLYAAIGPVWEANHVWLILVLVAMFGAFPVAFAGVCRALWLPLLLALAGIVFRGVGFAFRSYTAGAVRQQVAWDALFAMGSTAAPFFLGASVGALASGKLAIRSDGGFEGNYLTGWMASLALFTGFLVVGMCAYLSSVYLAREASLRRDRELVLLWRRRALATGALMGVLALAGVVLVATGAPLLWQGFRLRSWPLVGGSIVAGFSSLYSLAVERYRTAVVGAALAVSTVIWGWGIAQFPLIVPPTITVDNAKAPANILWLIVATVGIGALLLFPALGYLFYLFKTGRSKVATSDR